MYTASAVAPRCDIRNRSTVVTVAAYAAAIVVISALSALQIPYQYGSGNQVFQLPTVHKLLDPGLYPGDALVESLQNYPSAAYPIIAGLSATLGVAVEPLYLAIWIALRLWIVAALMLIAARFVPDYWGRVFVALVAATTGWAVVRTLIGGEHIVAAHLTHTELAFALQLAALAAWLYRRAAPAGALLAGALYLNAMTTVHFLGFMVLLLAFAGAGRSREALLAGVSFAVPALPFGVHLFSVVFGAGGAARVSELFWQLQFALPNHHLLMDAWDPPAMMGLVVVTIASAWLARVDTPLRPLALAAAVYSSAMLVVSLLGGHLFPSKLVQMFHPLRGDKPIHLALILATPIFVWSQTGDRHLPRSACLLLPVIATVFMLGPRPPIPVLVMLPALLLLYGVSAAIAPTGAERRIAVVVTFGLLVVAVAMAFLPGARILAGAILLGLLAGLAAYRLGDARWALLAAVLALALVQIGRNSMNLCTLRFEWYRAGADRHWDEMAAWADACTPPDARFITPPWLEGWRCLSRRGTLVQYRDGSAMDWYPGFAEGWWARLGAIGCRMLPNVPDRRGRLRERYLAMTPADLVAAAERYGTDYVVMPANWPWADALASAHANPGYRAYEVEALCTWKAPPAGGRGRGGL